MATTKADKPVRERLLDAANELFYAEGIHTVGIDRVIDKAGVAKASLYSTFGNKEGLVRAYLELRQERRQARITAAVEKQKTPRDKILAVFDQLAVRARETDFRGCPFVNAASECPRDEESAARTVTLSTRAWVRELLVRLATDLGARQPKVLAQRLQLLYDGAMTSASMEGDLDAIDQARDLAEGLLDATVGASEKPKRRK